MIVVDAGVVATASTVADWAGTTERMVYQHYRHQPREIIELRPPEM